MKSIINIHFWLLITCFSLFGSYAFAQQTFKNEQLRYERVRRAYADKGEKVNQILKDKGLTKTGLNVYLRTFKKEDQIEIWAKDNNHTQYSLIKTYQVCEKSGSIGPKRKRGDYQVPEGFYRIDRFNPFSSFYLSLGVNYPNRSDRILGKKDDLGGDIFIHGSCVTIGCLPITDDQIKELYVFTVEAKNAGQKTIPVTMFPARLTNNQFDLLKEEYKGDSDKINLWKSLKKAYELFNQNKTLPNISFLANGEHSVK